MQVVAPSEGGFALRSESGDFRLQLKGEFQFDGRFYLSANDPSLVAGFVIRRARPIVQGTVAKYFDFNFTPDFGLGTAVLYDAFLDAKASPALAVKVGRYKPPIGLEHLQSDLCLGLLERAFPASLEPSRDLGVEIHGGLAGGTLEYAAGVFNGVPDGAIADAGTRSGKALVGRVFLSPFQKGKARLKGLGLGIAGSTETQSGATATVAGYKTGGQNLFFSYAPGVTGAGRTRLSAETSFFSGPVGILAEHVTSEGKLLKTTTTGVPVTTPAAAPFTFDNHAWQATLIVFLTGEEAAFNLAPVHKPFDPAAGHLGALQLAARINGFDADPETFTRGYADIARSARRATAWAVGLNWYPNRNLKQAVTFERTTFVGGAAGGGSRAVENALLVRSQLSF